ncbi:MAG: STAS domain-containing protein [Bryobacteraceae bacterium]
MPIVIQIEQKDGICILRFRGRLVAGVDPEFLLSKADEVKQSNCAKVLADFSEVSAVGSTGMGFIVAIYTSVSRIPNGRFVLAGAQPRVREVLDLTRLSTVIPMAADLTSGLAVLRGTGAAGAHDGH